MGLRYVGNKFLIKDFISVEGFEPRSSDAEAFALTSVRRDPV
jgi:hypothetical protein